MEQKKDSTWKWAFAAAALFISYQVGYNEGLSKAVPTITPQNSTYTESLYPDVTAVDATNTATPALALANKTESDGFNTTSTDDIPQQATAAPPAEGPWTRYQNSSSTAAAAPAQFASATGDDTSGVRAADAGEQSTASATSPPPAAILTSSYSPPTPPTYGCAENGSCYGDISAATGRPKTIAVHGYFRHDGTYVRGHYRSH